MNAIGYIRCSTQEQADSGLGLEVQAERIRAYCGMRKLELVEIVADPGVSGGRPLAQRDGGKILLSALASCRANAVVMLKLDRMFRNAADCLATIEQWERAGVALHILDLGGNAIDTTSAAGRFMLVVLAGAAEMERNLIRERTRSALAQRRASGKRTGSVPFGFDLAADGSTLIANEREQELIREMQTLRADGAALAEIADRLTQRRIPTKKGLSDRWRHTAVAAILRRTRPLGPVSFVI